ncbi:hypothetical protein MTBLM5_10325 [Magnetospirillum sp. LM-5]|uniref:cell envelope integrity protein TolA n=1 Tax=Magnetospirillum sp. LM-5 TaxID=2681466 RepID=UPI001384671A|nr:cell envelope integrity protein TolA [Magnetospirillum sp. LM-5]CAA7612061.1 hypothetical protein MTBLM5_10325 [Magnetospirillum sp. LM-5]
MGTLRDFFRHRPDGTGLALFQISLAVAVAAGGVFGTMSSTFAGDGIDNLLKPMRSSPNGIDPQKQASLPLVDRIHAHVARCWVPPTGDGAQAVRLRVYLKPDGSVVEAKDMDPVVPSNPGRQAAVDSARRAVRLCSPLPIRPDEYHSLTNGNLILAFDVAKAMGRR